MPAPKSQKVPSADVGNNLQSSQKTLRRLEVFDILNLMDCSVRLSNSLNGANRDLNISVEEFLNDPEICTERYKQNIKGFGRGSANELRGLLKDMSDLVKKNAGDIEGFLDQTSLSDIQIGEEIYARLFSGGMVSQQNVSKYLPGGLSRENFSDIFSAIPFPECVLALPVSVRLDNALRKNWDMVKEQCPSLGDFLRKNVVWMKSFGNFRNVGRKSVLEVNKVLVKIVSALLQAASDKGVIFAEGCDLNKIASKLVQANETHFLLPKQELNISALKDNDLDWEAIVLGGAVDPIFKQNLEAISTNPNQALEDFLRRELRPREFDVVSRRYGFFRDHRQTLQEIANGYNVTRERIRQLEAKAIKKCSVLSFQPILVKYIEVKFWQDMPESIGVRLVIPKEDIRVLQSGPPKGPSRTVCALRRSGIWGH